MIEINKIETGKRIRELREAAAETQEDLAKHLEVKRQIISYYENVTRVPNIEHLMLIACHYNTTTDYLLCLSDVTTYDITVKEICDYTGLGEKSVNQLHLFKKAVNGSVSLEDIPKEHLKYYFNKSIDEKQSVESYIFKIRNAIAYINQLIQSKHLLRISGIACQWYYFAGEERYREEYMYIKNCVKLLNELEFEFPEENFAINEIISLVAKACSDNSTKNAEEIIDIFSEFLHSECEKCENNKGGADNGKHN